ncbi:MAG: IS1595 family transposase [Bryobacteraceae bacterium]
MEPSTLQEAVLYFADPKNCREYLVARRWPNGVECPRCGSKSVKFSEKFNRWQCASHHDKRQFTLKTGTIFEESPIALDKWLLTMWQVVNCKNGVSSYEIAKDIGVTQKSAWFMLHRLREVMQDRGASKLSGHVEADETFIGGKVTNMHRRSKRTIQSKNDGNWGKTVVLGLLEREGRVRAAVAPTRRYYEVHKNVMDNVEVGSTLISDEYNAYQGLPDEFTHEIINKLHGYVRGRIHVNGMENFWSLLKRTLKGTYVSVDPVHLQAYVDEQVFRFNSRKNSNDQPLKDGERFSMAVCKVVGKRLTWDELTGKEGVPRPTA